MKKIITIFCLTLLCGAFQFAQAQSETRIGALLAYGTEVESLGVGVNAEFPILEKLTLAPSLIYYLPKEEGEVNFTWLELNGNANYYFLDEEKMSVYGLAGLNYTRLKVKAKGSGTNYSVSDGNVGLNLGGGANFNIGGSMIPFGELKYVIMDEAQLVLAAGVKFNL